MVLGSQEVVYYRRAGEKNLFDCRDRRNYVQCIVKTPWTHDVILHPHSSVCDAAPPATLWGLNEGSSYGSIQPMRLVLLISDSLPMSHQDPCAKRDELTLITILGCFSQFLQFYLWERTWTIGNAGIRKDKLTLDIRIMSWLVSTPCQWQRMPISWHMWL